jgi:hypothetical protein
MTCQDLDEFCRALPGTTYVVQWGGSHVWKVGGKVFVIGGWQDDEPSFTFKVDELAYEILREQPGLRPASCTVSGRTRLECRLGTAVPRRCQKSGQTVVTSARMVSVGRTGGGV